MEWNAKWDWENIDIFSSNAIESPKKLQQTDWGIVEADIDAGSFNLSGDCGGSGSSTSDVCRVSSAKSSISASTDCSSKEGIKASNFTFDSFGGFPGDCRKKKELARAELSGTSPSLETSVGSGEMLIGLKLGKRTYFENSTAGNNSKTSSFSVLPVSSAATAKKIRSPYQNSTTPRCQVEGCNLDLSSVKEYHRKHKVCESHSKSPKVVVGGLERRFCQQCSRFHSLSEFDEKKRSCRRRLSDHNARRRKPQQETIQFNSTCLSSSIYEGTQQMSFVLNNAPPHTNPAGNSTWESTYGSKYTHAKGYLLKPEKAGVMDVQPHMLGTQLPLAISMPNHDSSRLLQCKGSTEAFSPGFKESMLSSNLDAAPDLHRALSLLSTNSWGSCEPESVNLNHSMNVSRTSMPQFVMHAVSQGLPLAPSDCWQAKVQLTNAHMHALASNSSGSSHCQEIQLFTSPFDSGFYSNSLN